MSIFGLFLIFIGAPLLIYNLIAKKPNPTWQRLGTIIVVIGILIIILAALTQ